MFIKIKSNYDGLDFANSMGINDLLSNSNANSVWDTNSWVYTDGTTNNALYLALNRSDVLIGSSYEYLLYGVSGGTNSARIIWRHYHMKDGTTKDYMRITGYTGNRANPLNEAATVTVINDNVADADVGFEETITAIVPSATGVFNIRCSNNKFIKIYQWSDGGLYYAAVKTETSVSMSTSNQFMQVNFVPSLGAINELHIADKALAEDISYINEDISDINTDIERLNNSIGSYSNDFVTR